MRKLLRCLLAGGLALATLLASAAPALDETPRIAVISAFQPELSLLLSKVQQPQKFSANGVEFTTGTLQGKPVVLFLSGISMTNAAMTTQLALDRFKVTHIVVSGIAGGVNPGLHIGDVTAAQRWGQYLEVIAAREVAPGRYLVPGWAKDATVPNFGMFFPQKVEVRSTGRSEAEHKFWFDADPGLLAIAGRMKDVPLGRCDTEQKCLGHQPQLVVGGNGVSGQAFVDNASLREYAFKTFEANVLDMETAAMAQVAYANGVPFIAFRSLSDLAGGGEGENEIGTFFKIAADNSANVLLAFLAAWK
ncbi:5'-methylthioadenosine/S-adenosylhomocysteine nucleosidase [Ramlibacter sp. G-1-2-2]|uniref:5'-methylthioadenosine/S-adenosylhomocysteine nucleosidase n=1 Tax=Ramlibacter agri TaxID=2728837 RepID=A0A848HDW0_9BURK|nr:5'-methylthioadenosine/S-adenosylhomocysteine nucleosidase [Ramlibacter agri]NML45748.1 5'-methylthioadenosine/S-adenosylhomocysteine nucleosidase [Ramlibacter agri]